MEPAIRRAGRLADGYIRTRGGGLEPMKSDLHQAEEAARAAGRDASALAFAQLQNTFVWEDGDAWEVAGPYVKNQLGIYGGWAAGGDTPEKGFLLAPPDDGTMRQMTPAGTAQEVAHALRPMVDAFGGRKEFHLIVRLHYPGMDFHTSTGWLSVHVHRGGFPNINEQPSSIVVPAGQSLYFVSYWNDVQTSAGPCRDFDRVKVTLPDNTVPAEVAASGCLTPSSVDVGPVTRTPPS